MVDAKPWTRLKGERTKAFNLFTIYRDLGPERSLKRAHAKYTEAAPDQGDSMAKPVSKQQLEIYSRNNNWVERAEAYDDYLEEKTRLSNEKEIEEMNKRHARDAKIIQNEALSDLQDTFVDDDSPSKASVEGRKNAAARTWKIGVDAERLARGVATEKVEQSGTMKHKGDSSIDMDHLNRVHDEDYEDADDG